MKVLVPPSIGMDSTGMATAGMASAEMTTGGTATGETASGGKGPRRPTAPDRAAHHDPSGGCSWQYLAFQIVGADLVHPGEALG